ncbi:MAG: acetyl-CoA carboxylase biotin carboxyl carrier protein [Candidatus Tokpelaia sp. JSC161]|jgi:acetyl-CoA carboxylase biotin carboxyl carrier protein|nr:MAG: acetyl-CoA carboxylase biotin carboxyl carrier protein [Candidatus Tokpelaia sp. JSC161]
MIENNTDETITINTQIIRSLAEILNETNLSEIEVEQGNLRIRISRTGQQQVSQRSTEQHTASSISSSPIATPTTSSPSSTKEDNTKNAITSPMVGTAYLSASPNANPFVQIGQQVDEGQTLLIVEAMKTMNQIHSPRSGIVKKILIEDAQPVEFGEPLIVID